jgi:hypothetical protein
LRMIFKKEWGFNESGDFNKREDFNESGGFNRDESASGDFNESGDFKNILGKMASDLRLPEVSSIQTIRTSDYLRNHAQLGIWKMLPLNCHHQKDWSPDLVSS